MAPGWQLSVWISGIAGKYAILDDVMGVLASNYFTPTVMILVIFGVWFGTRDTVRREHDQNTLMRAAVGTLMAFLVVTALNHSQSAWGMFWERPYVNHPEAENAMNLLYWPLSDSSFPSNAITGLAAIAAGLWIADRRASLIIWGLVGVWGFARVYVGIHYPIDIAGGMLIGAICAFIALKLISAANPLPSSLLRVAKRLYLA